MTSRSSSPGWHRAFDLLPLLPALYLAGRVLRGFAARIGHPFDLEWMEGGMLGHAWRLTHGLPLYPEAGPDWVPYVYPPGYPAVLAALSPVTGLDYAPGRVVSVLGVLLCCAATTWIFARRGQALVGLIVACCFLGCWRASGAFYDLVRPDGLAIGLLTASIAAALERRRGAEIASGLLLFAAFAVKHHSAAFGVPLALGLWLRDGRAAALRFGAASAGPGLLFTLAMTLATGGRFLEYLIVVPATHPVIARAWCPGPPASSAAGCAPRRWRRRRGCSPRSCGCAPRCRARCCSRCPRSPPSGPWAGCSSTRRCRAWRCRRRACWR
ncbi:MAG: glycosyltransferase family 87 protein [Myxococcota bacterium]